MKSIEDKNFGLCQSEFEDMLFNLQLGDESLFKQIFLSNFRSCMNYLMKRCSIGQDQAYDVTMDTLLNFRMRCLNGKIKYGNLRFLFTQMAYQLFLKTKNETASLEDVKMETDEDLVGNLVGEEERAIMKKAWLELGNNCRQLLTDYYYNKVSLVILSEDYNKKPNALRKQKQRCIDQLRGLFQKIDYGKEYKSTQVL